MEPAAEAFDVGRKFVRVLRAHGQTRHRGRARAPQRTRAPADDARGQRSRPGMVLGNDEWERGVFDFHAVLISACPSV